MRLGVLDPAGAYHGQHAGSNSGRFEVGKRGTKIFVRPRLVIKRADRPVA